MKKYINILAILATPLAANATGMAVNLDNLYLQNFTSNPVNVTIKNLPESANIFKVPAKSICKINQPIMFLPPDYKMPPEDSASYAIMINTDNTDNPIVMDKYGLALASDSFIKAPSSGNVSQYSLFGFCGSKYSQYKFLNVTPHDNESSAPDFRLINCKDTSNFVYFINDKYIKVKNRQKKVDFSNAKECKLN